jgi:hypothetical protein
MHLFEYLRGYPDYANKYYRNLKDLSVHSICAKQNLTSTDIVAISDSSWQDCPDTGRNTCNFKLFFMDALLVHNQLCLYPLPSAQLKPNIWEPTTAGLWYVFCESYCTNLIFLGFLNTVLIKYIKETQNCF